MSKFTKQITKSYEFEGDTVTIKMKRLKRKDAMKLAPMMSKADEEGKIAMDLGASIEFVGIANEVLMDHVIYFSGLYEEDRTPLTKEDVFGPDTETYFMPLSSEVMGDLMASSFVSGGAETEKKSDAQLKSTSEECSTSKTEKLSPESQSLVG